MGNVDFFAVCFFSVQEVVGVLDFVLDFIGRAFLANPHYAYQLAQRLGQDNPDWILPAPYAHWLAKYRGAGKVASSE